MRSRTGYGICEYCGKEFAFVKRADGKGYIEKKYCCDTCMKSKHELDDKDKYGWGICEYCGKRFRREKKLSGRGYKEKKFCSVECENKHHHEVSERNYGWGECKNCGKKFKKELTKCGSYSASTFCSDLCKNEYLDIKYPYRIKYCRYCGKRIEHKIIKSNGDIYYRTEKKFCNSDCELKFNTEIYGKRKCKNCGNNFYRPTYINYKGYREYKRGFKYEYCDICRLNLPRTTEEEQKFALILQENNIEYDNNEFRIGNSYFDFHITNFNILIDVNPSFTHTIKETYFGPGKSEYYHYDRVEISANKGYLYICLWDWSNTESVINIIKEAMNRGYNYKYKLIEHDKPYLVYYDKLNKQLYNVDIANEYTDDYNYLPVFNCGMYKYENVPEIFDNEKNLL